MYEQSCGLPDFAENMALDKRSLPPEAQIINLGKARQKRFAAQKDNHRPVALIYRPSKSAITSGARPQHWCLELQAERPQWVEPLMGWTSGNDPNRYIHLAFPSRAKALAYAKRQGWHPMVLPECDRRPSVKDLTQVIPAHYQCQSRPKDGSGRSALRSTNCP